MPQPPAPDYGLDAPPVVRNLLLAGTLGLALWASIAFRFWIGVLTVPLPGVKVQVAVGPMGLTVGLTCLGMALAMIWSSKVGKVRERERLLASLTWTGRERVLDIGCGRGLMLLGAAKRLTTGRAFGVDLWRTQDLAGNRPAAALANAAAEGVAPRVSLETADMRHLPFAAQSFDVVVSQAAIHNLPHPSDRALALAEIARVLRPGGQLLLADIRHIAEYARALSAHGMTVIRRDSRIGAALWGTLTFGALRPGVLIGRQPD